MALTQQQLLHQMAVETAYSFKGHMKTADAYGFTLALLILVPIITSLLVLIFDLPVMVQRLAAAAGFLFSSIALTSTLAMNKEKADQAISGHIDLGNEYLSVYNEIKVSATDLSKIDQEKLDYFQKKIAELNRKTASLRITLIGRWWSKCRINKEMDLTWIE